MDGVDSNPVTEALLNAMTYSDGAESVLVIFDMGKSIRIYGDPGLGISDMNMMLDLAKAWLFRDITGGSAE
jgi:hypothetical protein